ncbi:MAG: DDE-type integrase/transposase/recombinase [Lachnospiraceae bacterium]|jgi:transposase-like protein|nr:DDE-type integrase/transposase/recombinase [Lachnospiraceae bacterium]
MNIILYLLSVIQSLYQQNRQLISFICKYIPLRQWAYDDSHSPEYQKFSTDTLPKVIPIPHKDWNHLLREYQRSHDGRTIKPVRRRRDCDIPDGTRCPCCGAPAEYIYRNNGGKGQYQCKVCHTLFSPEKNRFHKSYELRCPFCGHALVPVKNRKFFVIWKCVNSRCPYYADRLKKVRADSPNGKSDYKLHYIYREFSVDFFRMELGGPSRKIASMRFRKYDANVMGLCLTLRVNLQLSLRQTSQALQDLYGFRVSHQQIANYCRLAALCVKPFVDSYQYHPGSSLVADETYIKIRGIRSYIWLIMDSVSRSILGYRVSGDRTVGPCIMAMRMAFRHFRDGLPKDFRFIADGYSAYPLAAQQFFREFGERMRFEITQVIGLRNGDAVTTEFRPFKQLIERLNRTYKSSYRTTNGYDGMDGADCDLVLWVAYYNFLRPHTYNRNKVLNAVDTIQAAGTMPGQWQVMIYLGQKAILESQKQKQAQACS